MKKVWGITEKRSKAFIASALVFASFASPLASQAFIDVEGGVAFTGYNDVAIPADTGTMISLADEIQSDPALALRLRLGFTFADRHTLFLLAAPLTATGKGTLTETSSYKDAVFPAGTEVESRYRFDSYRLTYRYLLADTDALSFGAGITAKVRSADIALMSDTAYARRSDLGVVPLINFAFNWNFADPFGLVLEGDALVTPFGRAEDVLAAIQYTPSDRVRYRIGYRLLEGGSDGGGDVYTFALFHYVTAGVTVTF